MNFTDVRLRIKHFFRKYKKIIYVAIIIWLVIFLVNQLLKLYNPTKELEKTYEPHTSVMDTSSKVPTKYQTSIEDMIEEYVNYCNNNDFDKAYNMLSDDCKKYAYPTFDSYLNHLKIVMYTPKKYSIQDYSNINNMYIYSVKYTDDILATGLTNSEYSYTEEKMAFQKNDKEEFEMSVGNFIKHEDMKLSTENEYLKIDVRERIVNYATEKYTIRLTNRSDYAIVISDYKESNEIFLTLSKETREAGQHDPIILNPNETKDVELTFDKFVDDNDNSYSITFGEIRVLDKYYGADADENTIQDALTNSVAKFSMNVSVNK